METDRAVPISAPAPARGAWLPGRLGAAVGGGFRTRLFLSLVAVVLFTTALIGGLAYQRFGNALAQQTGKDLATLTDVVAGALVFQGEQVFVEPSRLATLPERGRSRFQVIQGERVYFNIGGRFPQAGAGWVTARRELENGFVLEAALDTRDRRDALRAFAQTQLLAVPVAVALSLAATYFLFAYLMRPVRRLTEATHALAQQRFPEPLPVPPGNDELADLAQSFNRMSEAVRGFLERERSFTRYASHELRTPLAAMRVQVEALEQGLLTAEETIPAVKSSLERIERILVGLLALSRSPKTDAYPVPLSLAVSEVRGQAAAGERGRLEISGDLDAYALGYSELVQQALGNLVRNALKFSQGPVRLEVKADREVEVVVSDQGPGVPEHLLSRLGEPFFRAQPRVEGIGLGLALVRHIVGQLGGRLEFSNRPQGGLEARLFLPRAELEVIADA